MWSPEISSMWLVLSKNLVISPSMPKNSEEFELDNNSIHINNTTTFIILDEPYHTKMKNIFGEIISLKILCSSYGICYINYTNSSGIYLHPELFFKRIL